MNAVLDLKRMEAAKEAGREMATHQMTEDEWFWKEWVKTKNVHTDPFVAAADICGASVFYDARDNAQRAYWAAHPDELEALYEKSGVE